MQSATPRSFALQPSRCERLALRVGHALAGLGWCVAQPGALPLVAGLGLIGLSLAHYSRRPAPVRLATDGRGTWSVAYADGSTARGRPGTSRLLPGVISVSFAGRGAGCVLLFHDAFRDTDHAVARLALRHGPAGGSC